MEIKRVAVSVVMRRRHLDNPWQSEKWEAVTVLPGDAVAAVDGPQEMPAGDGENRWRWDGLEISLYPDDAAGYLLNVESPEPRVFVCWRMTDDGARPELVSVSYSEASRWVEGSENVDGVPMPPEWIPAILDYARRYYQPETRRKRRRT